MSHNQQRIAWGVTVGLGLLYLVGFFMGWASAYASWHLLLVVVAILFIFSALSQRGT